MTGISRDVASFLKKGDLIDAVETERRDQNQILRQKGQKCNYHAAQRVGAQQAGDNIAAARPTSRRATKELQAEDSEKETIAVFQNSMPTAADRQTKRYEKNPGF